MAEIFNDAALQSLRDQQSKINLAINEMIDYQRYGAKFTTADKADQITSVKTNSSAVGVDLGDWEGNVDPG